MFNFAERDNLYGNLINSIKVVVDSHEVFLIRALLLIPFLSNDVKDSISTSFFSADFIDRVLNDLPIVLIDVDNNAEDRMTFNHCYKNCNHLINHLLSLMNLILKLSENIGMLHR